MLVLLGIGLLAGVVTALSPCVLPVLPILLAGGASGRRPIRVIAGLVLSFSVFTLFATWILDQLGLPQDFLRNLAIASLFVLAALGLVFHVDDNLATLTPGYTTFLQNKIEDNGTAKRELAKVRGGGTALAAVRKTPAGQLPDYGE